MADYDVTSFDVENTFSSWLDGTLSPEEEAAFMIFVPQPLRCKKSWRPMTNLMKRMRH